MRAAVRGAAGLTGLALAFGIAKASGESSPHAPVRVVHLQGTGIAAGWYGADTLREALAQAGGPTTPAVRTDAPLVDGDALRVQDGWVLHELPFGRGDIPPQRPPDMPTTPAWKMPEGRAVLAAGGRLSLNHATAQELEALPGVGPALAARIVEGRPYASVDALDDVRGIGPRTLGRLRPWVRP